MTTEKDTFLGTVETENLVRIKGRLTSWNDEKGYGFITPLTEGERIFIHISAFQNRSRRPSLDQIVTYTPSTDKKGRACAIEATLTGDRLISIPRPDRASMPFILAVVFMLLVVTVSIISSIPLLIPGLYLALSLITIAVYAKDKIAAKRGSWRTQESTLHLLSLAGGWPGALIAQHMLRHKSSKQEFRVVFWATVVLNCGAFFWLLTPDGSQFIRNIVG